MTFVTAGLAIAGLAAMSIPIIIHLLSRQRRRPVEWAAMRFLIEAFRRQKRRLQLQQLLLLAVRCLIVLLLGAALARPLLTSAGIIDAGGGRVVYFLIDDGLISGVEIDGGATALDQHVDHAIEIIRNLDASDRVGIITASQPAQAVLSPPSGDHRAVMRMLRDLSPAQTPTDLDAALRTLADSLGTLDLRHDQAFVYLLSEFRAGSARLDAALPDALRSIEGNLVLLASEPADTPISNVQVIAVEPVRQIVVPGVADGSGQVTVRLARHGGALERDHTRVRLRVESLPNPEPRTVQWDPGQSTASVDFIVNFDAASDREVSLAARIDDDALVADNIRQTMIEVRPHLRVLLLERRRFGYEATLDRYSSGRWIRRALEPIDGGPVQVVEVEPAALTISDLRTTDVAVAPRPDLLTDAGWEMLRDFVFAGGLLIVVPPGEANVHPWTERLAQNLHLPLRIGLESSRHEEGLFLADEQPSSDVLRLIASDLSELARPVVTFRRLLIERDAAMTDLLLMFQDESPALVLGSPASREISSTSNANRASSSRVADEAAGMVAVFAMSLELDWTNLPAKPLMVPLIHELVRQGAGAVRSGRNLQTGTRPALSARGATELIGPDGEQVLLDERGRPRAPLMKAGLYEVRDAAAQRVGTIAVNVDPAAANTETQAVSAVLTWLGDSGRWATFDASDPVAPLLATERSSPLAGLLLLIVLLLVVTETLLARWFSNAFRDEDSAVTPGFRGTVRPIGSAAGGAA